MTIFNYSYIFMSALFFIICLFFSTSHAYEGVYDPRIIKYAEARRKELLDSSRGDCGTSKILIAKTNRKPPIFTVEERIQDCKRISENSKKVSDDNVEWNLVVRYNDRGFMKEAWRDSATGLLWGDSFQYINEQGSAYLSPTHAKMMSENFCESEGVRNNNGDITEKTFSVPTEQEALLADKHGFKYILPNFHAGAALMTFWVVSLPPGKYFDYPSNIITSTQAQQAMLGRCVAR